VRSHICLRFGKWSVGTIPHVCQNFPFFIQRVIYDLCVIYSVVCARLFPRAFSLFCYCRKSNLEYWNQSAVASRCTCLHLSPFHTIPGCYSRLSPCLFIIFPFVCIEQAANLVSFLACMTGTYWIPVLLRIQLVVADRSNDSMTVKAVFRIHSFILYLHSIDPILVTTPVDTEIVKQG